MEAVKESTPFWTQLFALKEAVPMSQVKRMLSLCFRSGNIPFLVSHTSQGKTTTVKDWCEENDHHLHIMNMSGLEGTDLTGIPFPLPEDGRFVYLQDGAIPVGNDDRKVVLFFDEVNRCEAGTVHALFQVLNRLLGSSILGPNVKIVLAANPDGGAYSVNSTVTNDPALLRRVSVIPCHLTFNEFMRYATAKKWHPSVIEFLQNNTDMMQGTVDEMESGHIFVTSGGWNKVSDFLKAADEDGWEYTKLEPTESQCLRTLFAGTISPRVTQKFMAFLMTPEENLSIREVMRDLTDHNSRAYTVMKRWSDEGMWGTFTEMTRGIAHHILTKRDDPKVVIPVMVELFCLMNKHTWQAFTSHMTQVAEELGSGGSGGESSLTEYAELITSKTYANSRVRDKALEQVRNSQKVLQSL